MSEKFKPCSIFMGVYYFISLGVYYFYFFGSVSITLGRDQRWHHYLSLEFEINPKLPLEVQQALQADYHLGSKTSRTISVRHAMLGYICREMERIDWKYGVRLWLDKGKNCYQKKQE